MCVCCFVAVTDFTLKKVLVISCFPGHSMADSVHDFTGLACPVQLISLSPSGPPILKDAVCELSAGMWFDVVNWAVHPEGAVSCKKSFVLTSRFYLYRFNFFF